MCKGDFPFCSLRSSGMTRNCEGDASNRTRRKKQRNWKAVHVDSVGTGLKLGHSTIAFRWQMQTSNLSFFLSAGVTSFGDEMQEMGQLAKATDQVGSNPKGHNGDERNEAEL